MELTGLERLQRGLASRGETVPFLEAAPMPIVELAAGRAVCELPETTLSDRSFRVGGALAALADRTLGAAVLTTLPAGLVSLSAGLHLDFVAERRLDRRPVTCTSRGARVGDRRGFAQGSFVDDDGRVLGHATLHTVVVPAPGSTTPSSSTGAPAPDVPLPAGLDFEADVDGGHARLRITPDQRLANSLGMFHGGAIAVVLDLAGTLAVDGCGQRRDTSTSRLDFDLRFLRPTALSGPVECHAEVTHRSRAVVVVDYRLLGADGRITASARSSDAVLGIETDH